MKHRARKRFGQHFLTDPAVIDRIVDAIDPRPAQRLVEIGPGLGALTRPLLERCGALTVIELDRDLAARWRGRAGVTVIEADVLQVDFAGLAAGGEGEGPAAGLRVVGNLPYNISTPILFRLFDVAGHVADQHVMLQREVVERMVAEPGGREFGRLSVMLQWRYRLESLLDVPAQAFDPPPQVESAVVRMRPRELTAAELATAPTLAQVAAVAFSQRRKLLRHTLGRWLDEPARRGAQARFDLQRRAEEVPVDEYANLAAALAAHSGDPSASAA